VNYDSIGKGYAKNRRADPRIFARITEALGDARTVVNVGAGAGSYEPDDRSVVAVELSGEMIRQRTSDVPVVQGNAMDLPFRDGSFDAALASLTIHHWPDVDRGVAEMRRVARRLVVFTHTIDDLDDFWLTRDYFPEIVEMDHDRFPPFGDFVARLGARVAPVPVPADCTDGFLAAYWARPEAYLDPDVRASMSVFPPLDPAFVTERIGRLRDDLRCGRWDARNGHLRDLEELDVGYRLVIT
jgi:SAM-dependent methyltransferase